MMMPMQRTDAFASPFDQIPLARYAWSDVDAPRGVVQIAHGLAEHSARYDRLARALNTAGYRVAAIDHRGHGDSIVDVPGDFGAPGWDGLIGDLVAFEQQLRSENPDLPLFLVAHSMGSFATQSALLDHSDVWDGVVLSGTAAIDVMAAGMATSGGGLEAFNEGFEHRTGYEWLSRDEAEVDAYVADPLCGFETPQATMPAIFSHAERLGDPAARAGVRADLPLLLISGSDDPLAHGGEFIELVGQRYRDAGVTEVTVTIYPGGRHEVFNETNRDEVVAAVVGWIQAHTPA